VLQDAEVIRLRAVPLTVSLSLLLAASAACSSGSSGPKSAGSSTPVVSPQPVPVLTPSATGTSRSASRLPTVAPKPSSTRPPPVILGLKDSGHTILITRTQRVRVRLEGPSWAQPTSSAPDIVVRLSGKSNERATRALFEGRKVGSAKITSTAPGSPAQHWSVIITVH
jgi:hypothetical protein